MPFDAGLKKELVDILGPEHVKDDAVSLYSYRCDGLTLHPSPPMGVVFPADRDELIAVVRLLASHGVTFLPRGAGTGLSGGAVPNEGSVIIEMFRMRAIRDIDPINRTITVEPGVVNIHVSDAAEKHGLYFVPDPSSQKACTVGGNVGENSGGPHTLKYGVTVNHVVELEAVMPDGELIRFGGPCFGEPGPDLLALMIGSEGTLGIVTEITCRLTPLPEKVITMLGVFTSVSDACRAVSGMIRRGVVPAALEMIDQVVIQAVEKTIKAGFPLDAAAVLIIELEDIADGMDEDVARIREICEENQAVEVKRAKDEAERAIIWKARKEALGAIGSISPSFYTQDGVIPRSALPDVLDAMLEVGRDLGLLIANVFHAGDGNLHPLILYDSTKEEEAEKVIEAGERILKICLDAGGALSGEHGIGLEKAQLMDRVFSHTDLEHMKTVRSVFNEAELLNPGKMFPHPGKCSETKMVRMKTGVNV